MPETTTTGGVSWISLVDKSLQGWFSYLNRPRDPRVSGTMPAPSSSDVQVAVLNAQLQAQQQNHKMLLLAGGALAALYVFSR